MKKYIIPIIIVLLAVTLIVFAQKNNNDSSMDNDAAGVSQEDEKTSDADSEPGITGYVMKKENGRILVVNTDAQDFSANGGVDEYYEAIWFSKVPENINVGEKVAVWFDVVLESYPGQSEIKDIKVITGEKPEGAQLTEAEAINMALTSEKVNSETLLVVKSVEYDEQSHAWNVRLKEIHGDKVYDIEIEDSSRPAGNPDTSAEGSNASKDNSNTSSESAGSQQHSEKSVKQGQLKLDDDLQLGNLKVNMTRQMIDKVMKVGLQRSEKDNSSGIESEFLYYDDGTVIHLADGRIYSITVTSDYYATPRGLKVGDSSEKLQQLYGKPSHIDEGSVWVYSSASGYDLFFATVRNGNVVSIKVSQVM